MNILNLEFLDKIISILKIQNKKLTSHEINVLFITDDLYSLYKKEFKIDNCIPILVKDGCINETVEKSDFDNSNIKYYSLTAEGLKFIGYVNTYYNKLSEEEQKREMFDNQLSLNKSIIATNNSLRSTNIWMRWLTVVIALGTVVSAIYYLIEIFSACSK